MRATSVTGARSASGSNGCLPMCGLTENTLSGASSQVWPSGALFATGVGADVLAAAGAVLDHHRLRPDALQPLRDGAGDGVRASRRAAAAR